LYEAKPHAVGGVLNAHEVCWCTPESRMGILRKKKSSKEIDQKRKKKKREKLL